MLLRSRGQWPGGDPINLRRKFPQGRACGFPDRGDVVAAFACLDSRSKPDEQRIEQSREGRRARVKRIHIPLQVEVHAALPPDPEPDRAVVINRSWRLAISEILIP